MPDTLQPSPESEVATSRSQATEWHFEHLVSVLYRRRWVSLLTFLVAASAALAYTLTMTPFYEAHAQLLLVDSPNLVAFQGGADSSGQDRGYLETQHRLLRSRSLVRRVIDELDLWNAPALASARSESSWPLGLLERWGWSSASSADIAAPTAGEPRETRAESLVIDRVLLRLTVVPVRDSSVIEVRFESPDPKLAAAFVNTLTRIHIEQDIEARSRASREASAQLTEQLDEQRRKMQASEQALQDYRERENSVSLDDGQNIVLQRLAALNTSVTQAKTDLIAAEARYRQLAAIKDDPKALATSALVRSNAVAEQLRERLATLQRERTQLAGSLGEKHPEMMRIEAGIAMAERDLVAEMAQTVESVRQDVVAAQARERQLSAALEAQKASALALNRNGIEYSLLLREVESNRQVYQSLLQRANEVAVSSGLTGRSIDVVDPAEVPRRPVRPDTTTNVLVGLLLAGVLGIGMAFVWETFDSRIQTPSEAKDALGLPFLGMLPLVSKRAMKGNSLVLTNGVPAAYAEACRSLRTNVLASAGSRGGRSLLITSAAPGDGKSVVAVNLALALGRTGGRILIVDADLRRPTVHQLMEHRQRPGLSEVLTGAAKPSEAIVATRSSNVWLLPSGAGLPNPSEQLGSSRFREFVEKLSETFDWVIIDSPPVLAVTDPAIIAQLTSGVLFVVNAQRTRRQIAQGALDQLESAGASFAGVVLNAVTLDRDHYYNARYYVPTYSDYHTRKRSA
jgi:capsular exopolysaccharide synthesis family protein